MSNIKLLITELYRAFHLFNKEFYNNSLPEPSILIQNRGNKKNVLGWCTIDKTWKDIESNTKKYEIALISEYLYRGMLPILCTLLHEMVHLHNLENNIKDCTRNNTYHNKNFKTVAENHGLICEHDKSIGWSLTRLQESTINFIKKSNLNENIFTLTRIDPILKLNTDDDNDDNEKKSTSRKYVCPECGIIVRATKDVNIICGDCKISFKLEE